MFGRWATVSVGALSSGATDCPHPLRCAQTKERVFTDIYQMHPFRHAISDERSSGSRTQHPGVVSQPTDSRRPIYHGPEPVTTTLVPVARVDSSPYQQASGRLGPRTKRLHQLHSR